jgi:hypothetical protein
VSNFAITCDYGVPDLVVDRVVESPTCTYNFFARSQYACPKACYNYEGGHAAVPPLGLPFSPF